MAFPMHLATNWMALVIIFAVAMQPAAADETAATANAELLSDVQCLTFEGKRAGEGYFSADGRWMVFQSERDPANPFYQIFLMDLETGDVNRVSPGTGKTTCAWIHPNGNQILFASTHEDEDSVNKQNAEIELRKSGKQRRYSWDYDPAYELYVADRDAAIAGETDAYRRVTNALGYDAEASFSPDGSQIVLSSNRAAYSRELNEREQQMFEIDPAYMMDLYIMNADGSNVRQLTNEPGYDGGPFFSPDGKRICWRRFAPDGATAEIFTMRTDGTDVRQLTHLNAMSWAPYFHPSGEYLVFMTNRHGFANFELYLVRADGEGEPVRLSYTEIFDGLPVFLPGGDRIAWTSQRVLDSSGNLVCNEDGLPKKGKSQIFMASYNHAAAREILGISDLGGDEQAVAAENLRDTTADYSAMDARRHVDYLTRSDLGGRLTGSAGERRATAYVAAYLESLGFEPAGDDGTFFHEFDFPAGSELGNANRLQVTPPESAKANEAVTRQFTLGTDWTPLSFSKTGTIKPSGIVFGGYGLQIPGDEGELIYDSYVHLNVADQWVLVYRDLPQDITPEQRQKMARYSSPRRKATVARDLGARGILFVSGPTSKVRRRLIKFDRNASQAEVSIAALSISDELAQTLLDVADRDLGDLQKGLDTGEMAMGWGIDNLKLGAEIEVERKTGVGRNVIARLPAVANQTRYPWVMVGAHIDHLGMGAGSNSLARDDEQDQVHVGADDNASGVAAMLEICQSLANEQREGKLKMERDFVVAAWSGEELGLFGSMNFVDTFSKRYPDAPVTEATDEEIAVAHAHGVSPNAAALTRAVAAYLNLDMVGRLREKLIVQGAGSSPTFEALIQRRNIPVRLPLQIDRTATGLPTDASAFVSRDVPILSAFTGAHEDYHTPRDTADKLNYEGIRQTAKLFGLLTRGFLTSASVPEFKLEMTQEEDDTPRAVLRAYLGTIPDYASSDVKGVKLSGVTRGAPADRAGLRSGDVVIELAGRRVEDINDYTYAIEALKIGETVKILVKREDAELPLSITPGSRD
ncbi:MAG: M28 family peptidase [Planctomycetota bacterium]